MKNIFLLFLIISCIFFIGCTENKTNHINVIETSTATEKFFFSSGGAYHPSGYGEWQVIIDNSGGIEIAHVVGEKKKEYGKFKLSQTETKEVWNLIEKANVRGLMESQRAGLPDEVAYTFKFTKTEIVNLTDVPGFVIWVNDAKKDQNIITLINHLGRLIEKFTKETPILN